MKKIKFIADKVTYETNFEEGYHMVGFSDNGDNPNQYIILQRFMKFDAQDIKLGMNSYYFEYLDQSNSGYGVCSNIVAEKGKILFIIKEQALNNIEQIEVIFDENVIEDLEAFKIIFSEIILKN